MKLRTIYLASARGVALIIVLLVITVLALLAGGFALSMKVETTLARHTNHDAEFEWLGRSGVELARYAVGQQLTVTSEPYDALHQLWAGGRKVTNEVFRDITLRDVELGPGKFTVEIVDQERKLNINVADETQLRLALAQVGLDAATTPEVADSILDWIDPDELPRLNGAESDYYLGLAVPINAKNGPLDDITELLLIRGVVPEMVFGSAAVRGPEAVSVTGRPLTMQSKSAPVYTNALADIFTVTSARFVNINTASPLVLQIASGMDAPTAEAIVRQRAGPDGVDGTEDDTPFRSVRELMNVPGMNETAVGNAGRIFSVRSAVFEVRVVVDIGGVQRTARALLLRNNSPSDVRVMTFGWQ
jgi:general secretion pathway protein K